MSRFTRPLFRLLSCGIALTWVGCGGSSGTTDDNGQGQNAAREKEHQCAAYEATAAGATIEGSWTSADDAPSHTIDIPSDPGGGVVRVEMTVADGSGVLPALRVEVAGIATGAVMVATGAAASKKAAFAVVGGASYSLIAQQASPGATYPADYQISWTFDSLVDCYEDNSARAEAKSVPLDVEVEAYMHAGFKGSTLPLSSYADWYAFHVARDKSVRVALTNAPADVALSVTIYGPNGRTSYAAATASGLGASVETDAVLLQAGSYLIEVLPAEIGAATVEDDAAAPGHFSQAYKMIVKSAVAQP